jgi:hypothetical protein
MRVAYSVPKVHELVAQSLYHAAGLAWNNSILKYGMCIRVLESHLFVYRFSEAGNEKYCCELHARRGLRFIIRLQEDA